MKSTNDNVKIIKDIKALSKILGSKDKFEEKEQKPQKPIYKKNNNKNKDKDKDKNSGYIGAPYNFVPFCKIVYEAYKSENDLPKHNEINDDLLSGEINYTVSTKTPLFVSNGADNKDENGIENKSEVDFYKNLKGEYAIPGSTLRGLIRNNMTILGFSSGADCINDRKFMYRQVSGKNTINKLKKEYNSIIGYSVRNKKTTTKIRAGYIKKEGKDYILYSTENDTNFYSLREDRDILPHIENFEYIREKLMCNGEENYTPYSKPILYTLSGNKVTGIYDKNDEAHEDAHKGYVISSGYMKNKKSLYVVPDIGGKVCKIEKDDILVYQDDFRAKENKIKSVKDFYKLPDDEKVKPVFYVKKENYSNGKKTQRVYLGFTPMLRVFYNYPIHKGIPKEHSTKKLDYVSAIMGYTYDKKAYKSRVYFDDAVVQQEYKECKEIEWLPGEPLASSYFDYVKDGKNYNDNDFELRGIKQYWLRKKPDNIGEIKNEKIKNTMKPIEGSFKGKIRFKNLKEEELGLLLWCLKLENNFNDNSSKEYFMNLGMAKPLGYGRVKIDSIDLKLYNKKEMYSLDKFVFKLTNDYPYDIDDYINTYKRHISNNFLMGDVLNQNSIKIFLKMKSCYPITQCIRYMDINKNEYQSRELPLPEAENVLSVKSYKEYIMRLEDMKNNLKKNNK